MYFNKINTNKKVVTTNSITINIDTKDGRAPKDNLISSDSNQSGRFSVVVIGTIENKSFLIECLQNYDYSPKNDTEQELVTNLFEWFSIFGTFSTQEIIHRMLSKIEGNIAIVIYDENTKEKFYAISRNIPLIIGVVEKKAYISTELAKVEKVTDNPITIPNNTIATIFDNFRIIFQSMQKK